MFRLGDDCWKVPLFLTFSLVALSLVALSLVAFGHLSECRYVEFFVHFQAPRTNAELVGIGAQMQCVQKHIWFSLG